MSRERAWLVLVTFERTSDDTDLLPKWAHGACGWQLAFAPNIEVARACLVHDLRESGFRVLEFDAEEEVHSPDDVGEIDDHLAANWRTLEPGKKTVWGTLHGYKGEGEA